MGNPYPVDLANNSGEVLFGGKVTFTDPANQPGGGGSQPFAVLGPIAFSHATPDIAFLGAALVAIPAGTLVLQTWVVGLSSWDIALDAVQVGLARAGHPDEANVLAKFTNDAMQNNQDPNGIYPLQSAFAGQVGAGPPPYGGYALGVAQVASELCVMTPFTAPTTGTADLYALTYTL